MSANNLFMVIGQLWIDDRAAVHAAELVLIMTLLMIGILVGMSSFRDAAVTEFADFGQALAELNQSYSYSGVTVEFQVDGSTATIVTEGSQFEDTRDFCDNPDVDQDSSTSGSRCVTFGQTTGQSDIPSDGENSAFEIP